MSRPDLLDLYNECLSVVEETTDDRTAERVVLIAARILHMADEDFARHSPNVDAPAPTPALFGALRGSGICAKCAVGTSVDAPSTGGDGPGPGPQGPVKH
jgi:hypothetical protein